MTFKIHKFLMPALLLLSISAVPLRAQSENKVTVPITDPSRPVSLRAHLLNGGITVKAYAGKDVIVEAKSRAGEDDSREERRSPSGMHHIPTASTGLSVEADNNQVTVGSESHSHSVDLVISVPVRTSLSLSSVNDGNIVVTGVDGEIDVNNTNGDVTLNNVSGSVVAHALNGKLQVSFARVDGAKQMAFSSLNGDIDVTFPADLKANVSMRTDNGEVYSDFDVKLQPSAPQQETEDNRGRGGKFRVKIEKTVLGTINGGGPLIQFKDFNGNIYIRKAGARQ